MHYFVVKVMLPACGNEGAGIFVIQGVKIDSRNAQWLENLNPEQ